MKSSILRNFLYLNNQLLDDFLSALDGELYEEGTVVEKSQRSSEGGGGVDLQLVKGGGKRGSSSGIETTKKVSLNYAGKFQRLYEKLDEMNEIQYYESMTLEKWNNIGRNKIIDCLVKINFSKLESMSEIAEQMAPLAQFAKQFAESAIFNDKSMEAIEGFKELGKLNRKNGVPCICSFINDPEYKLISYLNPIFLKVPKDQMIGELNIFCKVQRKLADGEKIELSNIIPPINGLKLNREQKRKLIKGSKLPSEFQDTIKSPAAVVIPVAIYS